MPLPFVVPPHPWVETQALYPELRGLFPPPRKLWDVRAAASKWQMCEGRPGNGGEADEGWRMADTVQMVLQGPA